MADKSMSTSSPFIRGIFFFLFLEEETNRTTSQQKTKTNMGHIIFLFSIIDISFSLETTVLTATPEIYDIYCIYCQYYNITTITAHLKSRGHEPCAVEVPSALGVTGDVVFQTVLLDLQRVVEGSIQLLHRHFDGTLQGRTHGHTDGHTHTLLFHSNNTPHHKLGTWHF